MHYIGDGVITGKASRDTGPEQRPRLVTVYSTLPPSPSRETCSTPPPLRDQLQPSRLDPTRVIFENLKLGVYRQMFGGGGTHAQSANIHYKTLKRRDGRGGVVSQLGGVFTPPS